MKKILIKFTLAIMMLIIILGLLFVPTHAYASSTPYKAFSTVISSPKFVLDKKYQDYVIMNIYKGMVESKSDKITYTLSSLKLSKKDKNDKYQDVTSKITNLSKTDNKIAVKIPKSLIGSTARFKVSITAKVTINGNEQNITTSEIFTLTKLSKKTNNLYFSSNRGPRLAKNAFLYKYSICYSDSVYKNKKYNSINLGLTDNNKIKSLNIYDKNASNKLIAKTDNFPKDSTVLIGGWNLNDFKNVSGYYKAQFNTTDASQKACKSYYQIIFRK